MLTLAKVPAWISHPVVATDQQSGSWMPSALRWLFYKGAAVGLVARHSRLSGHGVIYQLGLPAWQGHRQASAFKGTPAVPRVKHEGHVSTYEAHNLPGGSGCRYCASNMLDSTCTTVGSVVLGAAVAMLLLPEPAAALGLDEVVQSVEGVVAEAGVLGPLVFILAYALATVLLVPGSLLTLGAGALFGPVLGTAVVSAASTLGASAAFLVGRYLARPAVERRIASNPKFAAVDSAIAAKGPRIVLLLRLSPLFPFTLLNYALSLTKVEFWPYVLSSWAGMLPGTIAYVSLGGAGRAAAESASGSGLDPVKLGLYIVGAVATLWVARIISQTATRALQEASDEVDANADGGDAGAPLK